MISKAEYDEILAVSGDQKGQIGTLRHELDQLKRLVFGFKSERLAPRLGQNLAPAPAPKKD